MLRRALVLLVLLAATSPGRASWAEGMFEKLSRDFGSVPHGHTATHPFRLVNHTGKVVHISNVRVSCGCTSARAYQDTLAPGEETAILVQMDTRRFYGIRGVTVYVQFDQPDFDEVRLWVQADSRDDVVVLPETFNLGRIKIGASAKADVTVSFLGDAGCRITGGRCDSNYVQVVCDEVRRDESEVAYRVSARIRQGVPAGTWFTDVWLTTNSAAIPRLRVPLVVEVVAPAKVKVQQVALGTLKLGAASERQIILRGPKPFRVITIARGDSEVNVRDNDTQPRTVHVLTVNLRPENVGAFTRAIRVRTDLPGASEIELQTRAQVVP